MIKKLFRIGIDARLWDETGVGRYIRNLVKELQEVDKVNEYILFVLPKDYEDVKSKVLPLRSARQNFEGQENSRFKIVKADIQWHSLKEQLVFPKILDKENLDLVHFPYFSVPIFYTRPYVVTIHDIIIHKFPTGKASTLPAPLYFLKWNLYNFVLNRAIKRAKKIITVSNSVAKELEKELGADPKKIEVTYEGVDNAISNTKYQLPEASYFLYVGNVYPHKNVGRLIEAFTQILSNKDTKILSEKEKKSPNISISQYPNLQLVIVGKEDFFVKELKKQISGLPCKENILFLHNVTDEELASLYQNAIALVTPSKSEGFGLPALEALSNNCIVIASKIPVYQEILKSNAIYFDPENTQSLINALSKAVDLKDEDKSQLLSNFKKHLEGFSWKEMAQETLEIYESSVGL